MASLQADRGLDLILPLFSFLKETCKDAVYHFFVTEFREAQYIKENIGMCVKADMTLYSFLLHINQTFKDDKGGKDSKNKLKKSQSLSQASLSNPQQNLQHRSFSHPPQKPQNIPVHSPGSQQHSAHLNQYSNQPQATASSQHAAQSIEDLLEKSPSEIQNVREKEKTLLKLTVNNLLNKDDACQVLHELDLNFIVNVIINKHIRFRLNKELIGALKDMKIVRLSLAHASYYFTDADFEKNLDRLVQAVTVVRRALHLPDQLVQEHADLCRDETRSGNKAQEILGKLSNEAHRQYPIPDPSFEPPNITSSQMNGREVIEDVQKFIEGQPHNQDPIVLCGEEKKVKTFVLERLAYRAVRGSRPRFKVVFYLKDSHNRSSLAKDTRNAVQGFQDQLFVCLANLVPDTVAWYGLDAVKTVVKVYQKDILFLINWNVSMLGPVQSEMQQGTWVITYDGMNPSQVGWQVLRLESYTEVQVAEVLRKSPNSKDLLRCYDSFDSKDILLSWDMIQIFCEVSETITTGTDFEVVNRYVLRKVHQGEQDLLALGKLAFNAFFTKFVIPESRISDIQICVRDCFLYHIDGKGWSFKHSVVRDLVAAKYVASDSSNACRIWIKKDENIVAFKRVFKFVCFIWFQDNSVSRKAREKSLNYMGTFLRKLFCVPDKRESTHSEKRAKSRDKKSNRMKKKEAFPHQDKHKNPFDSWGFLLELDEACDGKREVLDCIAYILSNIPCWRFCVDNAVPTSKLTRLEKILKRVTLDKKDPLIIKVKSSTNITLLPQLWEKLRGIKSLYDCVNLMVTIEGDEASHLRYRNELEDFLKTVADTQVPLYITRYKGPLFSSCIPSLLKCVCMRRLKILEVWIYDVNSLCEVMTCGALPSLQEVFIKVNLELTEQTNFRYSIEFPPKTPVHITFEYFPHIQQLLDSFRGRHRLCSLSIHGLYVCEGFRLNLSEFSDLKSLNIRCEPELSGDRSPPVENDAMEVDDDVRLPRSSWLFTLLMNLSLPEKLERLLLRNVEFFDDSNQCLINNFFKKYNINRLLLLDTRLSLTGVGKILCSQTETEQEVSQQGGKKFKRIESHDVTKLATKNIRLPKEKREAMKWSKPNGKEVVITAEGSVCGVCSCFPCMCPFKVDRDGSEGSNSYERMVELINDMYCYNVQSFSYSFNHCTIRKDMCGDLRVECVMKCLTDTAVLEMESRRHLVDFFRPLMLAQCVTLEKTALSPVGVEQVAEHLRQRRSNSNNNGRVESFSLIVETSWHPPENTSFMSFKDFLKAADYLLVVHYRCGCTLKCFHVKKTYKGEIEDVIKTQPE